jgi:hypothetical protein
MDRLNTFLAGGTGVTGIGIANEIDFSGIASQPNTVSLLLQVIIAIVSLVKIIKGNKKQTI